MTEAGGPRGFDAGKKVRGRKRHVLADADGRPLVMQVHSADIQDRDGARPLLARLAPRVFLRQTRLRGLRLPGERVANILTHVAVEIIRKLNDQAGFAVLPKRWVVERFLAWINRNRRLAKDFEGSTASASAFLYAAAVMLLLRRAAHRA
jgi:transposase